MLTLRDISELITITPHLGDIPVDHAAGFIRLAKLLRPHIEHSLLDIRQPPPLLPPHVLEFIGASLHKSLSEVNWYWYALKNAVWTDSGAQATREDVEMFRKHGLQRGIGEYVKHPIISLLNIYLNLGYGDLFPPTRVCLRPECPNYRQNNDVMTLTEPTSYRATLFTLRDGALPVHTTSLYCHGKSTMPSDIKPAVLIVL